MAEPSWRQLAAIPESLTKRAVLHALAVDPPPEGIADRCELSGRLTLLAGEGGVIVVHKGRSYYDSPRDLLKEHRLSKGIPSGDLARWWLSAKGYL